MIEVKYLQEQPFRKVMEMLSRMGVIDAKKNLLFQKVFIISLIGKHYLVHYKEIINEELTVYDKATLNTIALLLRNWGLVEPINDIENDENGTLLSIAVVSRENMKKYKKASKIKPHHIKDFISYHRVNVKQMHEDMSDSNEDENEYC